MSDGRLERQGTWGMLERLKAIPQANWRDALRRGLQSALAAVAAYMAIRALGYGSEFLAILAAVLILQPSVGGTMGTAWTRLQATLVGSLLAFLSLALLPEGWGTAAALAVAMMVIGVAAGLRSGWSYGAVAATAMALAPDGEILETALERGAGIAVGAAVGVAVSLLVWPDRAEARFERHLRAAMRAAATRFGDAVEANLESGREAAPEDHVAAYEKAIGLAREALEAARFVDRAEMEKRLRAVRRLYNSVIILDRAAGGAPLAGAEALGEPVDLLRRHACEVLKALAEGKAEGTDRIEAMEATLERLREEVAQDEADARLHRGRSVVAFGMDEVRRSLLALVEASR